MNKYYINRFVVIFLMGVGMLVPAAPSTVTEPLKKAISERLGTRSASLVIFNDVSENYRHAKPEKFPFPWSPYFWEVGGAGGAMMINVLKVFASNQTLLCSATLWYQLQFFAKMWDDFAHMDLDDLIKEYAPFGAYGAGLEGKIEQYRILIRDLHNVYDVNSVRGPQEDRTQDLETIQHLYQQTSIEDQSALYVLQALYRVYLYVKNEQNYRCYDVNEWYLLFVPSSLVHNFAHSDSILAMVSDLNLTPSGMVAGLNLHLPRSERYREYLSQVDEYRIMVAHPGGTQLGEYAIDAVSKVMFDKNKIKQPFAQFASELLPTFNVLMIGHGQADQLVAGITISSVVTMLRRLDLKSFIQSVSIGSCYLGGKGLKDLSSVMEQELQFMQRGRIMQEISYPIIFAGSFFSMTDIRSVSLQHPFAFHLLMEDKTYQHFFEMLTQQDLETELPPPYYLKAMDKVFDVIDDQGLIKASRLKQYVSIKFPKVPAVHAYDYDKRVMNITPIAAVYKDEIKIPEGVRVILLKTDLIITPVEISELVKVQKDNSSDSLSWLTFLPVHYSNQNYQFREIRIPRIEGLRDGDLLSNIVKLLQDMFFAVPYHGLAGEPREIKELIYIVIDSMALGDVRLSNVVLSVAELKGFFDLEPSGKGMSLSYMFKYRNGKWEISVDENEDGATPYRVWVSDHTRGSKAFEKQTFLKKLNAVLKEQEDQLPDIVKVSRLQYSNMSPKAKEAHIFRKYKPGLNPHAKPFAPSVTVQNAVNIR